MTSYDIYHKNKKIKDLTSLNTSVKQNSFLIEGNKKIAAINPFLNKTK